MRYLSALLLFAVYLVNGFILPKAVMPKNYQLDITTQFGEQDMKFNFGGRVQITITCIYPTSNISLHSKDLEISENEVSIRNVISSSSEEVKVQKIYHEKKHDFLTISLDKYLEKGHSYEIGIPYVGIVNDGLEGFYRSMYNDSKSNETKWLGVTQFQATNARRAFPCFDEPAMKATFDIAIARKDGYTSISNMPLGTTEPIKNTPGLFWDHFTISKPMSTYLVAWVVSNGDFQAKELKHELNNVTFKIWCRKDALDQVSFASEVGPKVLRFFENYFGIDYPLPKVDMMAIPDLSARAMENWGLITFRENFLLYDPTVSTKSDQQQVAHVLAHELAHQWFGNLVTMKWWSDLWLNEGIAAYMSAIAVHHLFPDWNFLEEDHANSMLDVFSLDSLGSSPPVHNVNVSSSKDYDQVFKRISYKKGSCLIRMMSLFLGQETFRRGVINYLNQHKYQNAEQGDLWRVLTKVAHKENTLRKNFTVSEIMDNWTSKSGVPVISVKRNYKTRSAEITQKLFLKDTSKLDIKQCWWVPLTYSTKSKPHFDITTPKYWLNCNTARSIITIKNIANKDDWVVFNNKMSGLYKVNYDEANWKMLADVLKKNHTQIPALNRALLLSDAADLAYIGDLSYDVFFDLLEYLEHETHYFVLSTAFTKIEEFERHVKFNPPHLLFMNYIENRLAKMYKKVGGVRSEGEENANKIKAQSLIVRLSCSYWVEECLNDVQMLFRQFQEHPSIPKMIPKHLADIVYCDALQRGGENEWNFFWNKFISSNVESEKLMILSVLGCTREEGLLNRYLEWSLDKSKIRNQDCGTVFTSVAKGSKLGYSIAKSFFYQNIEKLTQYLKDKNSLSTYFSALQYRMIHDVHDMDEFKEFIKRNMHLFSDITRSVDQALETLKIQTQWQAKHGQKIQKMIISKYAVPIY